MTAHQSTGVAVIRSGMEDYNPRRQRYIDFSRVMPRHAKIHERLTNWGRWSHGGQGQCGDAGSPMFQLYTSGDGNQMFGEVAIPVNVLDAQRIASFMRVIPEKQRKSLAWSYVHPVNPRRAAEWVGVSLNDLAALVHEGREQLLILGA